MERYRSDAKNTGDEETLPARSERAPCYMPRKCAGLRTLDDLDGRTKAAKLAQRLVAGLVDDLGGDLTIAQRQIVQRIALAGAVAEDLEARWLAGERVDLVDYVRVVNCERRLLATIGLGRVQRRAYDATEDCLRRMDEVLP